MSRHLAAIVHAFPAPVPNDVLDIAQDSATNFHIFLRDLFGLQLRSPNESDHEGRTPLMNAVFHMASGRMVTQNQGRQVLQSLLSFGETHSKRT